MVFSLAFFHSVAWERRKYGPIGWIMPYEFNYTDFETSCLFLKGFLEQPVEIPWEAI